MSQLDFDGSTKRPQRSAAAAAHGRNLDVLHVRRVLWQWTDGAVERRRGYFRVVDETFKVQLLDERQIDAARRAANGGRASIPNGRVVAGAGVNVGWNWHLEDVECAELTTEVCDGRPSYVEREGVIVGGGRFCQWTARVISIDED